MYNTEKFIEKAKQVHKDDAYDYSKVNYVNSQTKVCIVCPKHGEFWQIPANHLRGNICPLCANEKRGAVKRGNTDEFIEKARAIHGDKYDYSKVNYHSAIEKVEIICPIHGSFYQTPMAHLSGEGCPKCAGKDLSNEEIIEKFKKVHGDRYDYSKVNYTNTNSKVCIICPEHGEFWQTPAKHLLGQGCPKCSTTIRGINSRMSNEEFIERCKIVHKKDNYDYSETKYVKSHDKVDVICPKHGKFSIFPYDLLHGHGCPICGNIISNGEKEIYEFLCDKLGAVNVLWHNRTILGGKEIDIYLPWLKIGIEYNGLYWHSEANGKDKWYHYEKMEVCNNKGIKLIQIFEDEYLHNKFLVFDKLLHIIGYGNNLPKVMGRKCIISEIDKETAKNFLNENHIQGYGKATICIGAFYQNFLVGVMTFIKRKDNEWELNRLATENKFICQGVGGKLFKYFIRKYNPNMVKSFADRRWTINKDNNIYTKLGFKLEKELEPDYHYIVIKSPNKRIHKFNLRKKEIHRKYNLSMDLTEKQMTNQIGLSKIWDCGLLKYIWTANL